MGAEGPVGGRNGIKLPDYRALLRSCKHRGTAEMDQRPKTTEMVDRSTKWSSSCIRLRPG